MMPNSLIRVGDWIPDVIVQLKYATADNITGSPFYRPEMPCLLEADTARMLVKAANELRTAGFRLKIWDAFRPASAHWHLWMVAGKDGFVAEPKPGKRWSWHCYGRAVDVTLATMEGLELPMPTGFDDFSSQAAADYVGADPQIRLRLSSLQAAMRQAGFQILAEEWWHFSNPVIPHPPEPLEWDVGEPKK
jgi:zinc D-Ala-D-Ala dipeptidase